MSPRAAAEQVQLPSYVHYECPECHRARTMTIDVERELLKREHRPLKCANCQAPMTRSLVARS